MYSECFLLLLKSFFYPSLLYSHIDVQFIMHDSILLNLNNTCRVACSIENVASIEIHARLLYSAHVNCLHVQCTYTHSRNVQDHIHNS